MNTIIRYKRKHKVLYIYIRCSAIIVMNTHQSILSSRIGSMNMKCIITYECSNGYEVIEKICQDFFLL